MKTAEIKEFLTAVAERWKQPGEVKPNLTLDNDGKLILTFYRPCNTRRMVNGLYIRQTIELSEEVADLPLSVIISGIENVIKEVR